MGAFLVRERMARLHEVWPVGFQLVVGVGLGVLAAGLVLVLRTDLVPDEIEAAARAVLFAALAIAALLSLRDLS